LGTTDAVVTSVDRFRNHYSQVPGDRGLSHDWQAKARIWIDDDARKQRGKSNDGVAPLCATIATDAHWDCVLKTYAMTGHWTRDVTNFGPDPTSPACRAPRHLLVKHGLTTKDAA